MAGKMSNPISQPNQLDALISRQLFCVSLSSALKKAGSCATECRMQKPEKTKAGKSKSPRLKDEDGVPVPQSCGYYPLWVRFAQ